ncbi:H/ACA ribonucleoprotein complex subunit 2-like protein [Oppia nitens]|uniref:H/ACA ribonucleoprotein complex subunit 2-like protein n=1 Tax=Oppia nitens TaxID=1686743 RepID=UPI0023D9CEEA|nr:H/ACA ribonucleoprotein complex subunit 2-like protein [Oppia nitens]XP_054160329.1 H/ACA ribonucleoprotein complex subunit 2-like protein [Oppia nitens]
MGKTKREKHEDIDEDMDVKKVKKIKIEEEVKEEEETEEMSIPLNDSRRWTELSYDQKIDFTSIIAKPMATRKLAKKLFKLIRKASKINRKTLLRIGLKDVQMRIRKGETGIVVFAGDVTPVDVMCHLPAVCEDKQLPYIYVPLRADISTAVGIKRPALMVLIKESADYEDIYNECKLEIKSLPLPI